MYCWQRSLVLSHHVHIYICSLRAMNMHQQHGRMRLRYTITSLGLHYVYGVALTSQAS